jgi:hypothetical protein
MELAKHAIDAATALGDGTTLRESIKQRPSPRSHFTTPQRLGNFDEVDANRSA